MRFSILKAGKASYATRQRRGDFDQLFLDLLSEDGQQWHVHDVEHGEFPQQVRDYDGFVITGSPASALDEDPWVGQLLEFTREAHAAGKPLLGICFGLQVVAQALGGAVAPNPQGWEIGIREIELNDAGRAFPGLVEAPSPLRILEVHQDIATRVPEGGVVLASSPRTPVEIFTLGETVLCLQGHPEMDNEIVRELIEKRGERGLLPKDRVEEGLASLAGQPHHDFLRGWLRTFIREGRLPRAA